MSRYPGTVLVSIGLIAASYLLTMADVARMLPASSSDNHSFLLFQAIMATVFASVVTMGISRGKNWARIALFLFVIVIPDYGTHLSGSASLQDALLRARPLITALLYIAAGVFAFLPRSADWFRNPRTDLDATPVE